VSSERVVVTLGFHSETKQLQNYPTKIMKKTHFILFLILHSSFSILHLQAQAWTKEAGKGFYKADMTAIVTDNVFNNNGIIVPIVATSGFYSAALYGEYGLTNDLTVVANIPVFVSNSLAAFKIGTLSYPTTSSSGFGDVDLGVRYQLYKGGVAVSGILMLGLPTGTALNTTSAPTGDGEFNQLVKVAVGTGTATWWTQGAVGFNFRSGNNSNEFRYDLEVGWKLFDKKLLAILKINGVESMNNGSRGENPLGLFSNNVGYLALGPELLYYATPKFGLSLKLGGALKGRNVQAAPSIAFGIFADM
jgi:hypothetical protein